jgi:hypothetical protein
MSISNLFYPNDSNLFCNDLTVANTLTAFNVDVANVIVENVITTNLSATNATVDNLILPTLTNDNTQTQLLVLNSTTNTVETRLSGTIPGAGNVDGPGSSTDTAIARFNGTTGMLIENSTVTLSNGGVIAGATVDSAANTVNVSGININTLVSNTNPLLTTSNPTFNNLTVSEINGQTIPSTIGNVVGPGSSTNTAIARFNGTTGMLIENSTVTLSNGGVIAGATVDSAANTVNVSGTNINTLVSNTNPLLTTSNPTFNNITVSEINGQTIPSTIGNVVGPGSSTNTAIAIFNGTTGMLIENSTATINGSGNVSAASMIVGSNTTTTGIQFQNNISGYGPATLNAYSTLSVGGQLFSGIWAGNVSIALSISRIGNTVSFQLLSDLLANATTASYISYNSVISSYLCPYNNQFIQITTVDNGVQQTGLCQITSGGAISIYPTSAGGNYTGLSTLGTSGCRAFNAHYNVS